MAIQMVQRNDDSEAGLLAPSDLDALKDVDDHIALKIGVIGNFQMRERTIMKNGLLTCCVLLTIPRCWATENAPVNVAPQANVWASSEYNDSYAARFAVDETITKVGSGSDAGQAWACKGAGSGDMAEFTLTWPQPVEVAEIVNWGRTGSLVSEMWKDYELYLDDDPQPTAKGTLKMVRQPQRITIDARAVRKIRLKFLNSHGALNAGSAEIAVYSRKPSQEQLDWFPLRGKELQDRIALKKKELADLAKVAATIPGKVVFLTGTRPWNHLDHQQPWFGNYPAVENHTHRCYIEKDTPGPANAGHQLHVLDPAEPDLEPELLVDAGTGWIGCAMSASYDGRALYFCMAPQDDPFFHIYSIPTSGGESPGQTVRSPRHRDAACNRGRLPRGSYPPGPAECLRSSREEMTP